MYRYIPLYALVGAMPATARAFQFKVRNGITRVAETKSA
jgi:hypothetical protein